MALTDKKRRFADALMSGASQAEAAVTAGYSEKTAKQQGYKLARDPDVLRYIERMEALEDEKQQASAEGRQVNLPDLAQRFDDPADFLRSVMNNEREEMRLRMDAAKTLMPYTHAKLGEVGKKEQKREAAKEAGKGRFATGRAPRLQ